MSPPDVKQRIDEGVGVLTITPLPTYVEMGWANGRGRMWTELATTGAMVM